jgi:hypothetical protein
MGRVGLELLRVTNGLISPLFTLASRLSTLYLPYPLHLYAIYIG